MGKIILIKKGTIKPFRLDDSADLYWAYASF